MRARAGAFSFFVAPPQERPDGRLPVLHMLRWPCGAVGKTKGFTREWKGGNMLIVNETVYIETSVVSYLTSRPSRDLVVAAHQQITREWWDQQLPGLVPYVSDVVIDEASRGDAGASAQRMAAIMGLPRLVINADVEKLAVRYCEGLRLPSTVINDALHMALAAWHGIDYLVSWNCSHIANAHVFKTLVTINEQLGISTPVLCTPVELERSEYE